MIWSPSSCEAEVAAIAFLAGVGGKGMGMRWQTEGIGRGSGCLVHGECLDVSQGMTIGMCLRICVFLCASVCFCVCLSVCLRVCSSVSVPVRLFLRDSVFLLCTIFSLAVRLLVTSPRAVGCLGCVCKRSAHTPLFTLEEATEC